MCAALRNGKYIIKGGRKIIWFVKLFNELSCNELTRQTTLMISGLIGIAYVRQFNLLHGEEIVPYYIAHCKF